MPEPLKSVMFDPLEPCMPSLTSLVETSLPPFQRISQGKVRDIYAVDENSLLLITTDRMSAFDVVMGEPIPGKGRILNQFSLFWMNRFADLVPNHILESDVSRYPADLQVFADQLEGRSVLARRAKPLPVECIVRGYISGSGWKEYQSKGTVCSHALPAGLLESQRLPEPLFTPSTKAELGQHDENISMDEARQLLGKDLADKVAAISLEIYARASAHAAKRGIIIADTKFEFGLIGGTLILIDEVLTPDSSRFWPANEYQPGKAQPSFDKQFLRDWLECQPWDKKAPAPKLPPEIIQGTSQKYAQAFEILTK